MPENVLGRAVLTVTWGAASDPDNNLTGYELERQVNGGSRTQFYKGADTSYTDEITRGWVSVNYRVRAYDAYNATSGYVTGATQPVNYNRASAITCDKASGTDLGKKVADFNVAYSVGDEGDDPVTVTETIDGVTLCTFSATAGSGNTFEVASDTFFKLLNGAHMLTVEASGGQIAAIHRLTFTKEVTQASVTLIEPFAADDKITMTGRRSWRSLPPLRRARRRFRNTPTGSCAGCIRRKNLQSWHRRQCIVTAPKPRDIVIYSFGHTGARRRVLSPWWRATSPQTRRVVRTTAAVCSQGPRAKHW